MWHRMAGLTLALQLRRQHPELSIAAVDKTSRPMPEAAHKVGESSVELGSQYLERLGLREYLERNHLLNSAFVSIPVAGTCRSSSEPRSGRLRSRSSSRIRSIGAYSRVTFGPC